MKKKKKKIKNNSKCHVHKSTDYIKFSQRFKPWGTFSSLENLGHEIGFIFRFSRPYWLPVPNLKLYGDLQQVSKHIHATRKIFSLACSLFIL